MRSQWLPALWGAETAYRHCKSIHPKSRNTITRRGHISSRYFLNISSLHYSSRGLFLHSARLLETDPVPGADPHSEEQIQKSLVAMSSSRKCTTIIVAHRLTSISHADRILVFDQGRIVEDGNHETLSRSGGIYEHMRRVQNIS